MGFGWLLLALVVFRILNAVSISTFFNPDEYWQSLEIAHAAVFGYVEIICQSFIKKIKHISVLHFWQLWVYYLGVARSATQLSSSSNFCCSLLAAENFKSGFVLFYGISLPNIVF